MASQLQPDEPHECLSPRARECCSVSVMAAQAFGSNADTLVSGSPISCQLFTVLKAAKLAGINSKEACPDLLSAGTIHPRIIHAAGLSPLTGPTLLRCNPLPDPGCTRHIIITQPDGLSGEAARTWR